LERLLDCALSMVNAVRGSRSRAADDGQARRRRRRLW